MKKLIAIVFVLTCSISFNANAGIGDEFNRVLGFLGFDFETRSTTKPGGSPRW